MANDIQITVNADDKASAKLKGVQGQAGKLGGMMAGALKAGAIAGGVALAGAGTAAVKMGLDFGKGMAEVKTLVPELSDKGFNKLKGDVLDLSKEMGIATSDMVPALYQAISAGVPPENAISFLRDNAKLAIGGVTDLATAVDLSTTVLNAWGLEGSELARVNDVMFAGVKAGKTTVEELSASMFQVAPIAAATGVSVEGATAALATLTASGVPTAQAATFMGGALNELGKDGTKASDAFKEIAGVGFKEFMAGGGDVVQAMELLRQKADEDGVAVGDLFGSLEAGKAVTILAGEGMETLAGNFDSAKNSAGFAEAAFETMEQTASYKLNKAINYVKVSLTELGSKALPVMVKGIEAAAKEVKAFLPVLKEWWGDHGPAIMRHVKEFGEIILGIARAVFPIIIDAIKQYMEIWQAIYKNVLEPYVIPILKKVGEFLLEHKPILVAVAAAILLLTNPWLAVVAAIVLVLAKWDEISKFFTDLGADIKAFVDGVIQKVSDFPIIGEIIKDTFRTAKIFVETYIEIIKEIVKAALNTIINTFKFWKAVFTGDWDAAWNALKDQAKVIWDLLSKLFGIALDAVEAMLASKLQMVKGIGTDLGDLIVNAAKKVWTDLKRHFGDSVKAIGTWVTGQASTIGGYGTDLGNFIVNAAKLVWDTLASVFSTAVNAVATWLAGAAGAVIAIGTSLGNLILDEAKGRWDLLKERFSSAVNAVATWLEGAAEAVTAIGTSLGNKILAGAGAVWGTLATAFSTAVDAIGTWIAGNAQGIFNFGASVGDALLGGVMHVLNFGQLLWDLVSAAWTWFGNFSQHLFNIGSTVGGAIWNGIKSAIGSLGDLLGGLIGSVPGVSEALGAAGIELQRGAWNIPRTMHAILHPGEMVLPRGLAALLRSGGGGGAGTLIVNLYVEGSLMGNEVEAERFARDIGDRVRRQGRGLHV